MASYRLYLLPIFLVVCALLTVVVVLFKGSDLTASPSELKSPALRHKVVQDYVSKLENEIAGIEMKKSFLPTAPLVAVRAVLEPQRPPPPPTLAAVVSTMSPMTAIGAIDPSFESWKASLSSKLVCKAKRRAMFYHYHTRKAAGTSIRDSMKLSARLSVIAYVETEGVVLDPSILSTPGLLSVTSLREPISRILSLYWYEHVGWYAGILKQPTRCKPLREWIDAWRDGSTFKNGILASAPNSNYVEIENYYTKMLSSWDGKSVVTKQNLDRAKEVLRQFDLVLISEWMGDETQIDAFNAVFKGRRVVTVGHKVTGDKKMKERLAPTLAPDEEDMRKILTQLNQFDIELYQYAQSLVALRLKEVTSLAAASADHANRVRTIPSDCVHDAMGIVVRNKKMFGVFQPKGHKGP